MLDMQVERWRHGSYTGGSNDKMLDSLWAGVVIEADLIWILGGRFLIKTYLDYSRLYVFRCTSMVSGQTNSSPDLQPQFVSW